MTGATGSLGAHPVAVLVCEGVPVRIVVRCEPAEDLWRASHSILYEVASWIWRRLKLSSPVQMRAWKEGRGSSRPMPAFQVILGCSSSHARADPKGAVHVRQSAQNRQNQWLKYGADGGPIPSDGAAARVASIGVLSPVPASLTFACRAPGPTMFAAVVERHLGICRPPNSVPIPIAQGLGRLQSLA